MDKTSEAPCNDGDAVLNSQPTQSAIGDGGSTVVLDEEHALNSTDATLQDFRPLSSRSDTVWSTTAQIDDEETLAGIRDMPKSLPIALQLTEARLRDTYFRRLEGKTLTGTRDMPDSPPNDLQLTEARLRDRDSPRLEEMTLTPEQMNQPCYCHCPACIVDQSMVPPQQKIQLRPMERYHSQTCHDESAMEFWCKRKAAPCKFSGRLVPGDQTLDKDENPKDRA